METAKDKAKRLVEKYQKSELLKDYDGMWDLLAIECAKIAVDELINEWSKIEGIEDGSNGSNLDYIEDKQKYWQ